VITVESRAHQRTFDATESDRNAAEIVAAMAALPPGDRERAVLRQRAIEAWLPMAGRLTRRYADRGEPFDDLLQTASVGLIKAIDGFDPSRGVDFVSYAIPTILGEIKRYFRDRTWAVRAPRRLQELRRSIKEARDELGHTLNRSPTVTDIATHLGVGEESILEALESGHAYRAISLYSPINETESVEIGDTLGSEDRGFELAEFAASLPLAMKSLSDREQRIIILRFYGDLSQIRIAEQIGISQMHVSRVLAGALAKLRVQLDEN
jgi:RNA polymerase sigma-B factor